MIEIKIEFNEKLLEFLVESNKPRKFEVGYATAERIISDGLNTLGMNATDILGFTKSDNERRIRRVRGAQAWFKKMYEEGWKYAGNFEYEGLSNRGFVVMEKELPNKTLDAIREELEVLLKDSVEFPVINIPGSEIDPEIKNIVYKELKQIEKFQEEINKIPKTVKEPKEGFESDVNDFMLESKKEMKSLEEIFFEDTGKNAVWRGKETQNFKNWKKGLENDS